MSEQEKKDKDFETASMDFCECPRCGQKYPKGDSCPKCKKAK